VLEATLDRAELAPGESVIATLRVTNISSAGITYVGEARDCPLTGLFWMEFPGLDLDPGRSWEGPLGELKSSVLRATKEGVNLPVPTRPGCGGDLLHPPAILLPGEAVSAEGAWDGRLANGYPAPTGEYAINVRFLVIAGPNGEKTLVTQLPVRVGRSGDVATPGRALDQAFGQPKCVAWVEDHPQATWARFDFSYLPVRRSYELTIEATGGSTMTVVIQDDGRGPSEVRIVGG